jgi:hypothetical protein
VHALTLGLVEGVEVNGDDHTLELVLVCVIAEEFVLRLGTVDDKLLRDRQRLYNDVGDDDVLVRDLELVPRLALVIGVQDLVGGHAMLGQDNEASMVPDLIDVGALVDLRPVKPSISREIGRHPICELAVKPISNVADCKNESNSTILGIWGSEHAIVRVDLKVERAAFVDIAVEFLPLRVNSWCRY